MKNTRKRFAVCIDNSDYEVSLERGKIYQVLPDSNGASHGYLRIIDESGEDYLFDSKRFFPITVSSQLQKALKLPPPTKLLKRTGARAPRSARRPAARR